MVEMVEMVELGGRRWEGEDGSRGGGILPLWARAAGSRFYSAVDAASCRVLKRLEAASTGDGCGAARSAEALRV